MRYGVVLHSSSHVVDRCSVIQSLSVSVTACAGYTPVQAVTGCVPVSVLVAVFLFLWELTPGRHNHKHSSHICGCSGVLLCVCVLLLLCESGTVDSERVRDRLSVVS